MSIESPESHKSLQEQFNEPETLELSGGTVEVYDIQLDHRKTEVPTVVAPGWAVTSKTFERNIMALAERNRRVITVDAPHGIDIEETRENIPEAEFRKVAALIETLEKKDIEKVDVVAHSEGGLYVALAASLYPEKFRNLVLVDPVGIIGQDNLARLSTQFSRDIATQLVRGVKDRTRLGPIFRSMNDANTSIIKNPLQTVREVFAMSNAQIHETLENLKSRGIGISVIHAVDDKAFPMERVQKVIDTDKVDGFYSVQGTHNELFLKPDEYSHLVDNALDALEKKNKPDK